MAGRGVDYKDLRLLPVAAIDAYTVERGMRVGGFGGRVHLTSRELNGVDANFLLGDHDQRHLSAAGGV